MKLSLKREDLSLWLISLCLAALIWLFVTAQPQPEVTGFPEWSLNVPVEVRDLPPGLILSEELKPVEVRLAAPQSQREEIRRSLRAYLLLGGLKAGKNIVRVRVTPPPVGKIVAVEPAYLELTLEAVTEKKVPVEVSLVGMPALEFAMGHPLVRENEVTLRGSPTALAKVAQVVAQVDVGEATADVETEAPVHALGEDGNPVEGIVVEPSQVHVQVPVFRRWAAHAVRVRVVTVGEVPPGYQVRGVTVEPVLMDVLVPPNAPSPAEVKTEPVDLREKTASFTTTVNLVPPPGGAVRYPTVQVHVEIVPEGT